MRKILSFPLIISIFAMAIPLFCLSVNRNDDEITAKIDEYMTLVEKNGFSGSLLVAKDGKIVLSKGYGLADRERNIPVTNQTVFTIGSITKQFTAAAILKLQMMGVLSVNDHITKYFENVPDDKKEITLHHLLTHTAGFPGAIGGDFEPVLRDEFIKLAMETKLLRKPGELYEYSNVGYSLLGAIIEIVTGKTYEAFLHEHLFKPAGMMKTGYRIPKWDPDELAHGYRGDKDWGTLIDKPWAEDGPYWHLKANGGILSTVEDMYKWHLALGGDKILSEEAKNVDYTPHVPEGEGADSYYGYGWAIFTTPRNTRLIAHNGGNMIFAADFLRYVDEDVVIIIMSNTAGKSAIRVSHDIARIVFGYDYKLPPEKIEQLSKDELKNSVMGRRALALLEIYMMTDEQKTRAFIKENFEPEFLKRTTEEKLLKFIQQDQQGIGETKIGQIVKTGENSLELTVQSQRTGEWWLITLEFEKQPPHQISKIGVVDTVPPASSEIGEESEDLNAKWGVPNSNTGRRSAALLEAIDRLNESYARQFIETNFAPGFLNEFSMDDHLSQFKKMHEEIGKLELLGAMKTDPNSARMKVRSIKTGRIFKIELELEPGEPYRIVGLSVEMDE
jgi:CubicO group peptidase (beta-lactamase class C family)